MGSPVPSVQLSVQIWLPPGSFPRHFGSSIPVLHFQSTLTARDLPSYSTVSFSISFTRLPTHRKQSLHFRAWHILNQGVLVILTATKIDGSLSDMCYVQYLPAISHPIYQIAGNHYYHFTEAMEAVTCP